MKKQKNNSNCLIIFGGGGNTDLKPILILFGIYLVGMFAMLRANFNYIDDLGRAITGYAQWSKESRYLSELLSRIVHADMTLFDVSPLPQVLAALILAVTGIIIKKQFSSSEKTSVWQYAALIPLCFFPYYLEAISYKFDAPYIALSVFFSVAPIIYRKNRCYVYFIACMLGTMGMCMTYQASSGYTSNYRCRRCITGLVQGCEPEKGYAFHFYSGRRIYCNDGFLLFASRKTAEYLC